MGADISYDNNLTLNRLNNLQCNSHVMLVLCGLPGSGKTTFAKRIIQSLTLRSRHCWETFNQDAIGNRRTVLRYVQHALQHSKNVIIDRCNVDARQRGYWVQLALKFGLGTIVCVVLPTSIQISTQRAYERGDDGLHDANTNWARVCAKMAAEFERPMLDEGFTNIYHCRDENDRTLLIESLRNTEQPLNDSTNLPSLLEQSP